MLSLLALLAPLLALWLWHPLFAHQRTRFWWLVAITSVLGVSPFLLIVAMRQNVLPFTLVSYLQVLSGGLFATLGMGLLWSLVRDALALAVRWTAARRMAARLWQPAWTYGAVALFLLLNAYGLSQGLRVPQVQEHRVALPRLPAALEGLRIGVLADIHATPVNNAAYVQALVERLNAAQPDMVVLPGDLIDGDAPTQAGNIAPLAGLRAPFGVWSAPGNHEYYSGYDAWA
ncbi:MAG: metallophosphoesterase, partial [Comamonas sp.]